MARKETKLDVLVGVQGTEKLRGLTNSLKGLSKGTVDAGTNTKKLVNNLKTFERTNVKSINNTRALINSYRNLAANVKFNSNRFKEATREAARLDAQLRKMQATANKGMGKGKIGGIAKGAGAIAAGGVFGGPEGAIGGAIGLKVGGPAGAAVGAAIGAQVGNVRKSLGELASFSAQLELQRKALKLVINDTNEYNQAQKFLGDTSRKLAIPQEVITRQFTSLTASVLGAGLSVDDAEKAFRAIAAGIRGTGGSLEDMKSAMRATAQVFSKGKVSAEELRQQLGERLPGAFTLFADSMDMLPKDLDKALEQGTVTLDDFMGFADHLFKKYGKNAEILAQSPAAAGDRLKTEMSLLKDNIGQILRPMGAEFQSFAADAVRELNKVIDATKKLLGIGTENRIQKYKKELNFWKSILEMQEKANESLKKLPGGDMWGLEGTSGFEETKRIVGALENKIAALEEKLKEATKATKELKEKTKELGETGNRVFKGMKEGVQDYLESIKDVGKQIENAIVGAFQNMEDALVKFTMTGKLSFNDFARQLIQDINRIIIRQKVMLPLLKGIDHLFNLGLKFDAQGSAYNQQGVISEFAKGGIVAQPTFFRYGAAGNLGIMGEAGPEAILPLKRGRSGNLGVESSGGGSTNIVVNVDASGSSVEGDSGQANEFGNVLAAAIQAELIKQKRDGGLLSNS